MLERSEDPPLPTCVCPWNGSGEPDSSRTSAHRKILDFAMVVVAGFILFALNVDFTLGGDAAIYADYALLGKFNELTLHIGYYAMLFVADRTVGAAFGIPIQEMMVWVNVFAGALTLGVAYLLARHFLGTRRDALLCVAVLAVCGRVVSNATMSEIYMPQTLLVLWSFYLFVRERVVVAGVVGGLALLISPLSAFAYLFYPVLDYQRAGEIRWKVWFRLAGGAALVYLPYLLVFGHELFWGRRGLLTISDITPPSPLTLLAMFPIYQFKAYTVLLALLAPALFAVRAQKRFLALSLPVILPHMYIIMKLTSEDNVFILNTDFFFACWLVIGWREMAKSSIGRWIAPLPLIGHILLLLVSRSIFHFDSHRGLAEELRKTAQTYVVGHDAVMVTDWRNTIVLTFYGRREVTSTVEQDPLYRKMYVLPLVPTANPQALAVPEIYVLDSWESGPMNRLLRSREALRAQRENNSFVSLAERNLNLQCSLIQESSYRIYRCVPRQGVGREPGWARLTK